MNKRYRIFWTFDPLSVSRLGTILLTKFKRAAISGDRGRYGSPTRRARLYRARTGLSGEATTRA